jgi:hypothetical protein
VWLEGLGKVRRKIIYFIGKTVLKETLGGADHKYRIPSISWICSLGSVARIPGLMPSAWLFLYENVIIFTITWQSTDVRTCG